MSADTPMTKENIDAYLSEVAKRYRKLSGKAMPAEITLIGGWEKMPENAQKMIREILTNEDMEALYQSYADEEAVAKDALITFDEKYPDVLQEDNLDDILGRLTGM